MKPGIPWSVKGVEPEVREAAKSAARRAGMTLGEWLNSVILDQNENMIDSILAQRIHGEDSLLTKTSSRSGLARAEMPHEEERARPAATDHRDDSALRLRDIARQLSELAQKERQSGVVQPQSRPAVDDGAAMARIMARIDDNERQTVEAFTAVNERLSVIAQQIAMLPRAHPLERPEDVPGYNALESAIRNVVEHIEVSEKRTRDSLKAIQDRLLDLAEEAGRHPAVEEAQRTGPVLAGLEARVTELSNRMLRMEAVLQSGLPDSVRRDMGDLRGEVSGLSQRLDEIRAAAASERDVGALRIALEQLSTRVAQGQDTRPLAELDRRLGELDRRIDEALLHQADRETFAELERNIDAVNARVARTEEQLGHVESMERAIRRLHDGLEETRRTAIVAAAPSPELTALQDGLAALRESSAGAERRSQETLAAVQETLAQIVARIAEIEGAALASANPPAESSGFEAMADTSPEASALAAATADAAAAAAPLSSGDDFIAAARRAAQAAAAPHSTIQSDHGALAPVPQSDRGTPGPFSGRHRKPSGHAEEDAGTAGAVVWGRRRKRLLLAGIVLLAAVSAFAFSMLVHKPRSAGEPGQSGSLLQAPAVEIPPPAHAALIAPGPGDIEAQYLLAASYEQGRGVPRDMAQALYWYERAAAGGHVTAMHNAAVIAASGGAGASDPDKAFRLFRAAAGRGLRDSQFNLAVLYETGLGVAADPAQARAWYIAASRQGDDEAGRRAASLAPLA